MHSCLGVVGAAAWGELAGLQMYRVQNPNPNPHHPSLLPAVLVMEPALLPEP